MDRRAESDSITWKRNEPCDRRGVLLSSAKSRFDSDLSPGLSLIPSRIGQPFLILRCSLLFSTLAKIHGWNSCGEKCGHGHHVAFHRRMSAAAQCSLLPLGDSECDSRHHQHIPGCAGSDIIDVHKPEPTG